jgi:uncharacterized RDD family membrane protein YckC
VFAKFHAGWYFQSSSMSTETLSCEKCGSALPEGSSFCAQCGRPLTVAELGPVRVPETVTAEEPAPSLQFEAAPPETAQAAPRPQFVYAGFWLRGAAFLLDTFILSFLFTLVGSASPTPLMIVHEESVLPGIQIPEVTLAGFVVLFVLMWLYYGLFESSKWQATPGKRMLRLYVTDLNGHPVTFGRASIRYLGRKISELILFFGYVLAGFTEKKQALHDIMAGCLVLRRR